jgi:hypothetical protein
MSKTLEERVASLERTVIVAAAIGVAAAVLLGKEALIDLPKAIHDTLAGEAAAQMDALLKNAKEEAASMAAITNGGKLKLDGMCFMPGIQRQWCDSNDLA